MAVGCFSRTFKIRNVCCNRCVKHTLQKIVVYKEKFTEQKGNEPYMSEHNTSLPSQPQPVCSGIVSTDSLLEKPLFAKVGTTVLTVATLVIFFVTMVATLFVAIPLTVLFSPAYFTADTPLTVMLNDGTVLSVSLLLNLAVFAFYCWLILKIRHKKFLHYLAFHSFPLTMTFIFVGIWLLFAIASEILFYLIDHQPMDFMNIYYDSAKPLWLLILGIVVIAPIYEELIFRGLLWRAIAEQFANKQPHKQLTAIADGTDGESSNKTEGERNGATGIGTTRIGATVATIITALLFTGIHMQYDMFELATIFTLALILGFARYRSDSLWLPILLHMINNGVSMLMYIYLG